MIKTYLNTVVEGEDLSREEARRAMALIMSGQVTEAQIAAFLVAMRIKGESLSEITGFAHAMREAATRIEIGQIDAVDTCGTGGDTSGTFNVSTAAAIVAAAAGVPVAKHGNRSVSSSSGSADVLRELGVNIEASPRVVENCIKSAGIGFLFAPTLHLAMKHAIGPRRELGMRTVFNILGPLTNPAGVKKQLIGLYNKALLETIAGVLQNLGSTSAMVVHSSDGMDEISSCSPTHVAELKNGEIKTYSVTPEDFNMKPGRKEDLKAQSPAQSSEIILSVLDGQRGPQHDIITLNAGAAIYVSGRAETLSEGVEKAKETIAEGKARVKLDELRKCSKTER